MAAFRLDEVARITGGRLLQGPPSLTFRSYSIDSRTIVPGELFFAVPGRRDGHDFVRDAAGKGAAGAVVSRPLAGPDPGFGLVEARDTVTALQDLARAALLRRPVKIVGITGSVGKTTTKEFTAALLSSRYRVLRSEGNFNNHLGLALSLLRLEPEHEAAVLEMGMSAPGEISALTRIAPPDVAVVTSVGPVHMEFFSSLEGIARAKKEILDGAAAGAVAVLNGDDPLVREMAAGWKGRTVMFGLERSCDVRASDVRRRGYEGSDLTLRYGREEGRVLFPFVNEALVPNLLAAAAVCLAFGLGWQEIAPLIPSLKPFSMRGVLEEAGGIRLYDDSYNSNPPALEAVLRSLAGLPAGRKVAVLADMLELGEGEQALHRQAGKTAAESGWDVLVAVGPLAALIAEGAAKAGMDAAAIHLFPDSDAAAASIAAIVRPGDLVLVKGSRGMRTEKIIAGLRPRGKE
ncbi:MAG: UDP-N-acetylmuramoyl-tripeptide--D-alanyl-D-alanine ligase [Candidatus Aminicenantes bacterium]|nr:UDP-N-acetylmuramoyl-tripeptide--D-alanyl-D-alanine ligase [Candidatus Aminicenantes bacterium]